MTSCWPASPHGRTPLRLVLGLAWQHPSTATSAPLMGRIVAQVLGPWRHRVSGAQTCGFRTVLLLTPPHPRSTGCLWSHQVAECSPSTKAQRPWEGSYRCRRRPKLPPAGVPASSSAGQCPAAGGAAVLTTGGERVCRAVCEVLCRQAALPMTRVR